MHRSPEMAAKKDDTAKPTAKRQRDHHPVRVTPNAGRPRRPGGGRDASPRVSGRDHTHKTVVSASQEHGGGLACRARSHARQLGGRTPATERTAMPPTRTAARQTSACIRSRRRTTGPRGPRQGYHAFRRGLVRRPLLVDRLIEADEAQLAVIVAPPGYGKSSSAERMGAARRAAVRLDRARGA